MNAPHQKHTGASVVLSVADNEPATRIELIPTGALHLDDARGYIGNLSNPAAVIAASMDYAGETGLPIDFDHGMDGQGSGESRAAGWITGLEVDGNRIMATVEWTPPGRQALIDKTYRFISPSFFTNTTTNEVTLIEGAGLTNTPAFRELKNLASQQETPEMPEWLKTLAAKLGMPDETDEAKIAAAAGSAVDVATHAASRDGLRVRLLDR